MLTLTQLQTSLYIVAGVNPILPKEFRLSEFKETDLNAKVVRIY